MRRLTLSLAFAIVFPSALAFSRPAFAAPTSTATLQDAAPKKIPRHYVTWKGQRAATDALPADLPEPARAAVEQWAGWAREKHYQMELDPPARVLLVTSQGASATAKAISWIDRASTYFDERLPAPPPKVDAPSTPAGGAIPEDPEAPPPATATAPKIQGPKRTVWGAGTRPLDTDTAVMFVFASEKDYASMLKVVGQQFAYLAGWAKAAAEQTGFVLEEPLAGAFVMNAAGQEEWSPDNELVHRIAELLLLRRFGRQPYWLQQGWAWVAEHDLCKGVFCFPYRTEFVFATEHTSWPSELKNRYAERGADPVAMDEIAALARGTWDSAAAQAAWGTIRFLAERHRDALPKILEDLRATWDQDNRIDLGDGKWRRDPAYEVPLEKQRALLLAQAGPRCFVELTEFFRDPAAGSAPSEK